MHEVLEWGLEAIRALQESSPALDLPFTLFTRLGGEVFFLLLLSFVYWCIDRRLGSCLTVLVLLSAYLNVVAKAVAGQPRPSDLAPGIALIRESTYGGFPSGHTQNSVVLWGYLAAHMRRGWLWVVAGVMLVLVPLSRVYLGVHFPTDLLGGYVIGAVLLALALVLGPRLQTWVDGLGLTRQLALAIAVPIVLAFLFATNEGIAASGTLLGMGVGFVLEPRWVGSCSTRPWCERLLGYLLGIAVLAGVGLGLRSALAALRAPTSLYFAYYGLLGLWGALGAPWLFARLGLLCRVGGDEENGYARDSEG